MIDRRTFMRLRAIIVAAVVAALAVPVWAQAPQGTPINIRGKIVKLDGQALTVKPADGAPVVVNMAPNFAVRTVVRMKLSDIHAGDFVGSTSVPGKDGKLHAVEVHVFPANAPIPEKQFPWDLKPGSV